MATSHDGKTAAPARTHIEIRVKRQDGPGQPSRIESFKLPYRKDLNVIACLQEIQRNPVTADGARTTPVIWDCSCLEEVCGACSMVVNGKVRQACTALIDQLGDGPVTLEPMSKFPLVRDLMVDRQRMFESLKKVRAWIPIDGTHDLGVGPKQSSRDQEWMYILSTCMTCGCCLEACPQVNENSPFMGAAPINQVRLFNSHPTGRLNRAERTRALMGPDGIQGCGKSQNCVEVCPKRIPLTTSLAEMFRATTVQLVTDWIKQEGPGE